MSWIRNDERLLVGSDAIRVEQVIDVDAELRPVAGDTEPLPGADVHLVRPIVLQRTSVDKVDVDVLRVADRLRPSSGATTALLNVVNLSDNRPRGLRFSAVLLGSYSPFRSASGCEPRTEP